MSVNSIWSENRISHRAFDCFKASRARLRLKLTFKMNYKVRTYSILKEYCVFLTLIAVLTSCASQSIPGWSVSASRGDNQSARNIILETRDTETRSVYGETPLLWAAKVGDDALVSQLLSMGADPNDVNPTTGETPLLAATKNGRASVLTALLKAGANRNAKDLLGRGAVETAVLAGKSDILLILVDAGFSIDPSISSSLVLTAAGSGNTKTVEHLLKSGASIKYQGSDGESVLMAAVRSGNVSLASRLLKHGADVQLTDKAGRTALTLASQSGDPNMCEILLSAGADINARDVRGNSPLMWSIMMGHHNLAASLVEKGADITVRNEANKNALYLSAFSPETTRVLMGRNAHVVETKIEGQDYYRAALAYKWLATFVEAEMSEGHIDTTVWAGETRRAYEIAARLFESTANQYTELASELRTKQTLRVVGSVLLTAASVALASASAHQQAHQSAEISALQSRSSGGSGQGVGYGAAPFQVITPGKSLLESAKDCDVRAIEIRKIVQSCRQKAECYGNVGPGQEQTCFKE